MVKVMRHMPLSSYWLTGAVIEIFPYVPGGVESLQVSVNCRQKWQQPEYPSNLHAG
jgi:hypothetical protein